jgi:hypothetical protein
MTTQHINCKNCGAPLDVPTTVRFVNCDQCGAQLTIQRSGSVSYTEAATGPALREVADRLEDIWRQNELARIDREWERERDKYMLYGAPYGRRFRPSVGRSILVGTIMIVILAFWTLVASGAALLFGGTYCVLPICGVVAMCFALGVAINNRDHAKRYKDAYDAYQRRRFELLDSESQPPQADAAVDRPETFRRQD